MSPKDCAYIVERLAIRFMALVAEHERQLSEHRAAFGARTEADAKIMAGLRAEIDSLKREELATNETLKPLVDRVVTERDGLLTQVQDMRAEITRLTGNYDLLRREYDKALTLCETDDQTPAECIGSLNARIDRLQDDARSDARVREDLHRINVELRAEVAFLKIRDREYEKALDLCDKEEQTPAECIAALQERMRASIVRGDFEQMEVAALKSQTPKQHPVKVGEWVKAPLGTRGKVVSLGVDYLEVELTNGPPTRWWPVYMCDPCDPPATHDTTQGKAAAEAALKTEPVAEEIKAGDIIEVVSSTDESYTEPKDIGRRGIVTAIDGMRLSVNAVPDYELPIRGIVGKCDVRKVPT